MGLLIFAVDLIIFAVDLLMSDTPWTHQTTPPYPEAWDLLGKLFKGCGSNLESL